MNQFVNIENEFTQFVGQHDFPCIGAKTALNKDNISVLRCGDMNSNAHDIDLLTNIYSFIENFNIDADMYSSFVAVFDESREMSENCFEKALWTKLQSLHNVDSKLYGWDSRVSANPHNGNFSFSLGGQAFFVIGLNPHSSRKSRQFQYPAIVFNLHSQFERLRERGKFEQIRSHIHQRDEQYCGSKNPMLKDHGEDSEALQYSGRELEETWECPFKANKEAIS
ncbi:guanitoxin biosynthesis heme-dependent pre-guanitoxin N-hydroxylase GntA [Alteromonas antoniana]|uniref:guanitoxin biosynthesis heme-dependent pre-guanitoxin N-hydroxylase GntA n=1 Tax=Alteromonas antoniana TaxID=2803813 RepID=UPI001C445981|nr:guanitoxin biosynthesis heme-dependent pre-guanitoxin N-hydroxylase GntA [Alteromonas antoniana]